MDLSAPPPGPLPDSDGLAFVSSREDRVAPAPTPGAPTGIEIALCSREWPGIAGERPAGRRSVPLGPSPPGRQIPPSAGHPIRLEAGPNLHLGRPPK
jgi:hypothetical protein